MTYTLFTLRAELDKLSKWLSWLREGDQWQREADKKAQIQILEIRIAELNEGIRILENAGNI